MTSLEAPSWCREKMALQSQPQNSDISARQRAAIVPFDVQKPTDPYITPLCIRDHEFSQHLPLGQCWDLPVYPSTSGSAVVNSDIGNVPV